MSLFENQPVVLLLVDDDIDSLKLVGLMAQRRGFVVHTASSGSEAIRKAVEVQPDVVLLDVMMPDMDGYEVCKRLREMENLQSLAIVMCTARSQLHDRIAGFEAGADDYLPKPIHPAEMGSRVQFWGRKRQIKTRWSATPDGERLDTYVPALLDTGEEVPARELLAELITQAAVSQPDEIRAWIGDVLIQLTGDAEPQIRMAAAAQMPALKTEALWKALLNIRLDQDVRVRSAVVRAIDRFDHPESIDLLLDSLRREADVSGLVTLIELVEKYSHPAIPEAAAGILDRPGVEKLSEPTLQALHKLLYQDDPEWATAQLTRQLWSAQDYSQTAAIRILAYVHDERAVRELVAFLRQSEAAPLRQEAIHTLKQVVRPMSLQDARLIRDITRILLQHVDKVTDRRMQEREISEAAEVVARKLSHPSLVMRGEAVVELARLRRKSTTLYRNTAAQDTFWRNVMHNVDSYTDDRIKEAYRKWGKMAKLAEALTDHSGQDAALCALAARVRAPDMRILALKAVGQNKAADGIPILSRAIHSRHEAIRRAATEALGYYGSASSLPALQTALRDSSISVRLAAVNAISALAVGTPQALALLAGELNDPDPFHRIDVGYALARVNTRPAVKALIACLKTETHPDVLYGIASALGGLDMNYTSIEKALRQLAAHSSDHVRQGAREALQQRRAAKAAAPREDNSAG